jgi:chemotaxis methyl-accepting protein methylase
VSDPSTAAAERLLGARAGLAFDVPARTRLGDVLDAEGARLGLDREAVVARAADDPDVLQALVDGTTLQESGFFRDPHVWAALEQEVLPHLPDPVRVWSAGCADGQEAWSAAMALDAAGRRGWRVLATDASSAAVATAREGRYAERRLRGLDDARRARYLEPAGDGTHRVVDRLRDGVTVLQHNLATQPPPADARGAHLVLCRYVLIYVEREAVDRFLRRVAGVLAPEGVLVVGAAEALWHRGSGLVPVPLGRGFAFRPAGTATTKPSDPRPGAMVEGPPGTAQRGPSTVAGEAPRPAAPLPAIDALLAEGARALAAGAHDEAVAAFRRAVYVAPDAPLAHLQLGLALEAAGRDGARRAFRAALAALERADPSEVEAALEGWGAEALARLLAEKASAP